VLKRFEAADQRDGIAADAARGKAAGGGGEDSTAGARPRRFERAGDQLWQSDIFTFLLRRHERVYVCAFMRSRAFHRGWSMAGTRRNSWWREALTRRSQVRSAEGGFDRQRPAVHGLAGKHALRGGAEAAGIRHLKSRPQHPQTLGKVERSGRPCGTNFAPARCLQL